jgi:aldehyde dehydrogenase (NAD+)
MNSNALDRRAVVARLLHSRTEAVVVAGLGNPTYDLAAAGDHDRNFYLWGAMGGAAMIGLGVALAQPNIPVVVITGDGEMLMGMGGLATIALQNPANLHVVVLDNGHYGETGSQLSHTSARTDLTKVAAGCGIDKVTTITTMEDVERYGNIVGSAINGPDIRHRQDQQRRGGAHPAAARCAISERSGTTVAWSPHILREPPMNAPTDNNGSISLKHYDHYIGGRWIKPHSQSWFESINPYNGQTWAMIARGSPADVDAAVATAKHTFLSEWSTMKPTRRGRLLMKLADLIEHKAEFLAEVEVRDNGKLYAEMFAQTKYLAEWYRYYGGLADKIEGAVIPSDKDHIFNFTRYEPLGVIGMITPWNSPLLLLAWKLPAALAAGNTAVIKPSEFTSASTLEFMSLFEAAGFPPSVVNTVTGFGGDIGVTLVQHPDIAKIAFTGSDVSGQKIYETAARDIKHVSLELGGKSPNIVFEDADIDAAVVGAISGIFAATGQTCIAGSRLLLQESIHDRFMEKLVALAGSAKIGDPMLPDTNVGPVTTEPQYRKVLEYIDIAKKEGAVCVLGGKPHNSLSGGTQFVEPTIFTGVKNTMRIAQEEVFGPVLAVIPFKDEDEAIHIANDVRFGLAAGVWTQNIARAIRMSERLHVGTVWVNTYRAVSFTSPFGGYKRSGLGRESGLNAIKEYLQVKSVWIATSSSVANPFITR